MAFLREAGRAHLDHKAAMEACQGSFRPRLAIKMVRVRVNAEVPMMIASYGGGFVGSGVKATDLGLIKTTGQVPGQVLAMARAPEERAALRHCSAA